MSEENKKEETKVEVAAEATAAPAGDATAADAVDTENIKQKIAAELNAAKQVGLNSMSSVIFGYSMLV